MVDPAIENNHFEHSPYIYVYNNPVNLIDPFGLDSIQRQQAIDASNKDVNASAEDDPEEYKKSDCSTTFDNWTRAGGDSYKHPDKNGDWTDESGAATILTNVKEASMENPVVGVVEDENDVVPGTGYVWKKVKDDGSISYHNGLVVNVERDKDGKITEITMNHSEYNRGHIQDKFNPNDKTSRWVKREHTYFRWDSKPDIYKAKIPEVTVTR